MKNQKETYNQRNVPLFPPFPESDFIIQTSFLKYQISDKIPKSDRIYQATLKQKYWLWCKSFQAPAFLGKITLIFDK